MSLRPRRGRWRVSLRYASRDARRHKGRTALVAIMVALPAGLGAAAAVLVTSTTHTPASRVAAELGTDHVVQASIAFQGPGVGVQDPADTSTGYDSTQLKSPLFRTASGRRTVDDSSTVLPVQVAPYEQALSDTLPPGDTLVRALDVWSTILRSVDRPTLRADVEAHQLDTSSPARAALGLSSELANGQVAVGADTAHDLGLHVGDAVELGVPDHTDEVMFYDGNGSFVSSGGQGAHTVGRYSVAEVMPGDDGVVLGVDGPFTAPATFDFWRPDASDDGGRVDARWFVVGPRPVTWDDITRANGLGATVFSRDVVLHPPAGAVAAYQAEAGDSSTHVSSQAAAVVGGAVILGLLQAILMIGPAFQVGARRAARDLALLAANGADARTIRRAVLSGALVVGGLASVIATAAGTVLAVAALHEWSTMEPVVPWAWLVAFAVVGALIALGAAWFPARRAARLDPALVLAGRRADPEPSRWPAIVGSLLAVLGAVVAVAGAVAGMPVMVLVAGIVVAEVGLVVASGPVVSGVARLARVLPGTSRLALRDAARHRARTAPAVAAVLAATAAAVAGLVVASSQAQHDRLGYTPEAATGALLVGPLGDPSQQLGATRAATVTRVLRTAGVVDGPLLPVTSVRTASADATPVWVAPARAHAWVEGPGVTGTGTVVDDGSSQRRLELLGVHDATAAATALAAGRVVVAADDLAADGTAEVTVTEGGDSHSVRVPAASVGGRFAPATNLPIIPPSVAHRLGLRTGTAALIGASRPGTWNDAVRTTLDRRIEAAAPTPQTAGVDAHDAAASVYVEAGHAAWSDSPLLAELVIAAGALVVALAAAWIATALAGTESLPDLATLQAVGAPPRTRRRFAAAQSAVITVTGAVLGAATGLVIGATVVLAERERTAPPDPRWMIAVPWWWVAALALAIPLLGAGAAWLVTRSRLPLARRLDG